MTNNLKCHSADSPGTLFEIPRYLIACLISKLRTLEQSLALCGPPKWPSWPVLQQHYHFCHSWVCIPLSWASHASIYRRIRNDALKNASVHVYICLFYDISLSANPIVDGGKTVPSAWQFFQVRIINTFLWFFILLDKARKNSYRV
jgi:hypothetical protein